MTTGKTRLNRLPRAVAFSLLLFVMLSFAFSSSATAQLDLSNYTGAKFEPAYGAYLGAYIYQDVNIKGDKEVFNDITGKKHASYFKYVGYGRPFPTQWVEQVKSVGAVPQIAWEPNDGLDVVQDDQYLRDFARAAAASDVPVFLRYASEMNGAWCAYHGDPELYIEKWRLVHRVMAEEAPNVAMVWTVFTFPQGNILDYYPGDEYVDWVGVNVYNVVYHNNNINHKADHQDPLQLIDFVYQEFSKRKPIHISEWGATHYTITDGQYYVEWAQSKLTRMYEGIIAEKPRIKAIYYFNVNNLVNAPEGRRINNYSLTCNEDILNTYRQLVSHDFYLSTFLDNTVGVLVDGESVELDTKLIVTEHSTYIPLRGVVTKMGLKPSYQDGQLELRAEGVHIDMTVNETTAVVNGQSIPLTNAPVIFQGRVYVELADWQQLFPGRVQLAQEPGYRGTDSTMEYLELE